MFTVTRYYVLREARGATVCEPEMFRDRDQAVDRGRFIGRRSPALVYSVRGEPVSDLWERPMIIARYAPQAEPVGSLGIGGSARPIQFGFAQRARYGVAPFSNSRGRSRIDHVGLLEDGDL